MTPFLLSQIFAFFGICTDIASWQFRSRRSILITLTCSTVLFGLHFYFLGQMYAALVSVIVVIRYLFTIHTTHKGVMVFFLCIAIGLYYFVGEYTIFSFLALLAVIFATIAGFQKQDKYLRLIGMASTMCWLTHNILLLTPIGIVAEVVMLSSNLLGYIRFYILTNRGR